MSRTFQTLLTALTFACSSPQQIIPEQPIPQSTQKQTATITFSEQDCWQEFEYTSIFNLFTAAELFQKTTSQQCYTYATTRASLEKVVALRHLVAQSYNDQLLHFEIKYSPNGDQLCQKHKQSIQQHNYAFLTNLEQAYSDARIKLQDHFPHLKNNFEYQQEQKKFTATIEAIHTSTFRPYCDSTDFETDLKNIE